MTDAHLERARDLLAGLPISRARRYLVESDDETLAHQVQLAEIPAPPFQEARRARHTLALLAEAGCRCVEEDDVGNVLGLLGPELGRPLILSAHLDTVFPPDTDVTVARTNGRLRGPGISDDARGLAALVAVARTLTRTEVPLAAPVLFVGTVGEEGPGNLRGVHHLFRPGGPARDARGFVSLDGAGLSRVVTRGLGVRRLRATVCGPGGHSWTDWGEPNPIHALGAAVGRIQAIPARARALSTATVARWGGGTSINAIPADAWIEVDLRSEVSGVLARTESRVREALAEEVAALNGGLPTGRTSLSLSIEVIGNRPAGRTRQDAALVRAALAATRALGVEPRMIASSTDSNVPMSLGIPAVTVGAGGNAGGAHTPGEWYENVRGPDGILRALLMALMVVGVDGAAPAQEAEEDDLTSE